MMQKLLSQGLLIMALFPLGAGAEGEQAFHPREHVEITAHRGASFDAPENTMASAKLAWEQKADSVEVDVYLTADGKIVCIHDNDTSRVAGVARTVVEQTLAELRQADVGSWKGEQWKGERIPTLEEVLSIIPEGRRMFIEIKCGPEITEELTRVVKASQKRPDQVAFISFSLAACESAKKAMPENQVYYLSGFKKDKATGDWTPKAKALIDQARQAGVDGLDLQSAEPLNGEFVKEIKAAGLPVYVWTVDDPATARRLAALGVAGITTNKPAFIRKALSEQ